MSTAYSTPEELYAEQEAILERISRCQDILGSAILRARVALGIEPTAKAFFTGQVSWAKRGAIAPQPARRPQMVSAPAPAPMIPQPAPVPVVVAPPVPVPVVVETGPPPVKRDAPETLAKFQAGTFFRAEVTWTARKAGAAPVAKPAKPSLAGQLLMGQETPALPVAPPVVVARPAPPPVDYTAPAGAFFRDVPWQPGQAPVFATRTGSNFLATATESALRAAQRLATKPAP